MSDPPVYSQRRVVLIVLIVAIAAFMQMLDAAVVAVAIPAMAEGFGVPAPAMGLGITIYVLGTALMIPASGWLADRFGARRVFVVSLASFTVASVLCGSSRTLEEFIAARALQGLAGAMLSPVGSIILMAIIARRDLIRMMNIFTTPMLVAPVIGPPLGGLITTWAGWPWIFYVNIPIGVAGAVLALLFIGELERRRRPFDTRGMLLNSLALCALVYGFDRVAEDRAALAWAGGLVLVGLVLGWAAIRHARRHAHPLLSLTPTRFPTFAITTLQAMPFIRMPAAALPFLIPILLQLGFGLSAFASGMLFLGHTGGDLLMKAFTTRTFARFGYRVTMLVAIAGAAVSVAACALFTAGTPFWVMLLVLFVSGCFRSFTMSAVGTLSYADIPRAEMTSATTLNQVVMQLTQGIGVSLTVLLLRLATGARDTVSAADCRVALVAVACLTAVALLPVSRLARDAGAELSRHRAPALRGRA